MTTTTTNKLSTVTALVSLASEKKAVKKPSKARRVNPATITELKQFDVLDKRVIQAEGKASEVKAKLVAFLNKVLLNNLW